MKLSIPSLFLIAPMILAAALPQPEPMMGRFVEREIQFKVMNTKRETMGWLQGVKRYDSHHSDKKALDITLVTGKPHFRTYDSRFTLNSKDNLVYRDPVFPGDFYASFSPEPEDDISPASEMSQVMLTKYGPSANEVFRININGLTNSDGEEVWALEVNGYYNWWVCPIDRRLYLFAPWTPTEGKSWHKCAEVWVYVDQDPEQEETIEIEAKGVWKKAFPGMWL